MKFNDVTLCDFCFSPVNDGQVCPNCGLTHETYTPLPGLLPVGTNLLGKYIIGRNLGRDDFGATYHAYSAALRKAVAVKEYLPLSISQRSNGEIEVTIISEEKKEDFENGTKLLYEEACTISKFNGIQSMVTVYEFFRANGTVYYSMEYLEGCDLGQYVSQRTDKLNDDDITGIIKAVCEALLPVHGANILHRNITPDNICMCKNGGIKLINFGVAKQMLSGNSQDGSVVLKPGFASPEQYSQDGKQGPWTDIYALGATMYYAASGKVPPAAMDRAPGHELEFDSECGISQGLMYIIRKCMALEFANRYKNTVELMKDIEAFLSGSESVGSNAGTLSDSVQINAMEESQTAEINSVNADQSADVIKKESWVKRSGKNGKLLLIGIISFWVAIALVIFLTIVLGNYSDYKNGIKSMESAQYNQAIEAFTELGDYKDSSELLTESKYLLAIDHLNKGQNKEALDIFNEIPEYKDSQTYMKKAKYNMAVSAKDSGDLKGAIELFGALTDYEDSNQQLEACRVQIYEKAIESYRAGEYNVAKEQFELSGNRERSMDYLTLISARTGSGYFANETLFGLIGFEDAASVIALNGKTLQEFLIGKWTQSSGHYIAYIKKGEGNISIEATIPVKEGSCYTRDGALFAGENAITAEKIWEYTIVSRNTIKVHCLINNKTYTLNRK